LYTVDIEKHSMGIGLRCWPSSLDYTGKDSASVATFAPEAAACTDMETLCSADSLQRLKAASGSGAADTPAEDPPRASSGVGSLAKQVIIVAYWTRMKQSLCHSGSPLLISLSRQRERRRRTARTREAEQVRDCHSPARASSRRPFKIHICSRVAV
jgi:hypothetical protein